MTTWRAELIEWRSTERRGFLWDVRLIGDNCVRVIPNLQEPDARALAALVNTKDPDHA